MSLANVSVGSSPKDSQISGKPRSQSSPVTLPMPPKPASPSMKSPKAKVPKLDFSQSFAEELQGIPQGFRVQSSMNSGEPELKSPKSPKSPINTASHVRFASSSTAIISTSAPSTPRAKSARHADEVRSPRRHRIDSSPRKTPDQRKRESDVGLQVVSSPRKINDGLISLGTEAAKLIFTELRTKNPLLTKAVIVQLARFETKISLEKLPAGIRVRITDEESAHISHAKLIKTLFLPLLSATEVGKTLKAMRMTVMSAYDGDSLTLVDVEMRNAEEPGFKKRLEDNLEPQGKGCAELIFGMNAVELSASKLPAELVAFWKAMDAELCAWAKNNPNLPGTELKSARANLGFDLLFTRLVLPMASGPKEEASLAIPALFFKSVKNALLKDWPKFVDSFIQAVESERSAALAASSTSSTSDAAANAALTNESESRPNVSSASSTSDGPVTTALLDESEPQPKDGVFQE